MKALETFLMEEELEKNRFQARFNFGESGHRPRTVQELLFKSGLTRQQACEIFLNMPLYDSPNWGRMDLRESIAALHPSDFSGAPTSLDNVLVTTGTSEALLLLFRALSPRKLAVALPAFQLLTEIPTALGAQIIGLPIEFSAEGKPYVNIELWQELLNKEKPDVVVFNSPHNPTGLVFTKEVEKAIVEYCELQGATLIADEHYRFLASETQTAAPSLFRYTQACKRAKIFVTGSFIKCVGAPGLRIGWCVGNRDVLQQMQNEKNYTTHTVNPVSEWIAKEVLNNLGSNLFQEIRSEWQANKLALTSFLEASTTWKGSAPEGGLVSVLSLQQWPSCAPFSLFAHQLRSRSLFILPMTVMGSKFETQFETPSFRIGLGSHPLLFKEGLEQLGLLSGLESLC